MQSVNESRFEFRNVNNEVITRPYPVFWRQLLRWLQRKCQHHWMRADLLEGSHHTAVRWCPTCGAVWLAIDGSPCGLPRMCEPTWEPTK